MNKIDFSIHAMLILTLRSNKWIHDSKINHSIVWYSIAQCSVAKTHVAVQCSLVLSRKFPSEEQFIIACSVNLPAKHIIV